MHSKFHLPLQLALFLAFAIFTGTATLQPDHAAASGDNTMTMSDESLIEWSLQRAEADTNAEIALLKDGRVKLGPRFGGGEYQLPAADFTSLQRYIFDEQGFGEIDPADLKQKVQDAIQTQQAQSNTATARLVPLTQADAGTTVIRAKVDGTIHEVTYHDLTGDAQQYPDVTQLQQLRRIELKMLELITPPSQ